MNTRPFGFGRPRLVHSIRSLVDSSVHRSLLLRFVVHSTSGIPKIQHLRPLSLTIHLIKRMLNRVGLTHCVREN